MAQHECLPQLVRLKWQSEAIGSSPVLGAAALYPTGQVADTVLPHLCILCLPTFKLWVMM